jgi:hypothetical protein
MTTLYRNGRVRPFDRPEALHEALGVRDGRVVAVGAEADVRRALGPGAEAVDLRGATIIPGLVDTHPHLMHFGVLAHPLVDLSTRRHTPTSSPASRRARERRRRASGSSRRRSGSRTTSSAAPGATSRRVPSRPAGARPRDGGASRDDPGVGAGHPERLRAQLRPASPSSGSGATRRARTTTSGSRRTPPGEPTGILRGSVTNYYTGDDFMNGLLRQPAAPPRRMHPARDARRDARLQRARRDDRLRGATRWTRA